MLFNAHMVIDEVISWITDLNVAYEVDVCLSFLNSQSFYHCHNPSILEVLSWTSSYLNKIFM